MSRFIAIEGGDGSGKGTQSKILYDYAKKSGLDVMKVSFPRYGETSAYYIEKYLNGEYGGVNDVHPDLSSLTYALDRFAASNEIRQHLSRPNSLVISDRYVASNLAHQGAKIADSKKRREFYERTIQTEYDILGIPKPDLNIVLTVPTETMQKNIDKKDVRSYTDKKRDIHEADANHLENAKQNFIELCEIYPNEFTEIACTNSDHTMLPVDEIHKQIVQLVS